MHKHKYSCPRLVQDFVSPDIQTRSTIQVPYEVNTATTCNASHYQPSTVNHQPPTTSQLPPKANHHLPIDPMAILCNDLEMSTQNLPPCPGPPPTRPLPPVPSK